MLAKFRFSPRGLRRLAFRERMAAFGNRSKRYTRPPSERITVRIENASDSLAALGERLLELVEEQTGRIPEWQESSGWYVGRSADGVFLYLRLVGEKARAVPPNSAQLTAKWHDDLADLGASRGNQWFGGDDSADLTVEVDDSPSFERAREFICLASRLRRSGGAPRDV